MSRHLDKASNTSLGSSLSLGLSSRKGIENLNLSASVNRFDEFKSNKYYSSFGKSGSISFNNISFTPSKRVKYKNTSLTFSGSIGGEIFGAAEPQVQITGYGSYQAIHSSHREKKEKAFGYENTQYKGEQEGVLDFNREKESIISQRTTTLPQTVYTYDTYSIDGQGIGGMFRPFRSQVSNVYNDVVQDDSESYTYGAEVGIGNAVHGGFSINNTSTISRTGRWNNNNNILPLFNENPEAINALDYEPITFKLVGGLTVDPEQSIYNTQLLKDKAIRTAIAGGSKNGYTKRAFEGTNINAPVNNSIKKTKKIYSFSINTKSN
ncbi:MAG: hypothetical protein HC854_13415 [Flavobacterium sp.]|nr:hypothetical protein [Flavobacterium sp.]